MKRMSIGQMAKLHGVSEKTLRMYHQLGLLIPDEIDAETYYRSYSILQSARLDMILVLKSIGLSLEEIGGVLDGRNMGELRKMVKRQQKALREEKRRVSLAQFTAGRLLDNIDVYSGRSELEKVLVEYRTARRILRFNRQSGPQDWGRETAKNQLLDWEQKVRRVKEEMLQKGIPLTLFHTVSCTVRMEDLKQRNLTHYAPFILVDEDFNEAETVFMPEGWYISYICNGMEGADGMYREGRCIMRLLDEIEARGYAIAGDYYGEVVGETPAFLYEGRDMMVKLQIPVAIPEKAKEDRS